MEYRIPEHVVPLMEERLTRFNKRAEELGGKPVRWETLGQDWDQIMDALSGQEQTTLFHLVEIEFPTLNIDGWEFVAKLEQVESDVLIHSHLPGDEIPLCFRNVHTVRDCEHCQVKRNRSFTYVLRNRSVGAVRQRYIQVGSTCLEEFTGNRTAAQLAKAADITFTIREFCQQLTEGLFWEQSRAHPYYHTQTYLAKALAMLNKGEKWFEIRDNIRFEGPNGCHPSDLDAAAECRAYYEEIDEQDACGTEHNVKVALSHEYVDDRLAYWLVRGANTWLVHLREKLSAHVGTIGEEYTANVKLLNVITFTGRWGVCALHKFSENGNILTWFASRATRLGEDGEEMRIKGRVKRHATYWNEKQTVLSRVTKTDSP